MYILISGTRLPLYVDIFTKKNSDFQSPNKKEASNINLMSQSLIMKFRPIQDELRS